MTFVGFPVAALDFYDDLEADNSKTFWQAHKPVYDEAVKAPMTALMEALEDEFGTAKLFRPYRDVRFSKNKTPYKTHQGAYVGIADATGWYAELSAAGFRVGAGFYHASPESLRLWRRAVDEERVGGDLEAIVHGLRRKKWTVGGDVMTRAPRGFAPDHPRLDLLKHRSLTVGKDYGFGELLQSSRLVSQVRRDWRAATPLVEWVAQHVTGQVDAA